MSQRVRSHDAAITAKLDGFLQVFNMLEGFEGDLDSSGKRNRSGDGNARICLGGKVRKINPRAPFPQKNRVAKILLKIILLQSCTSQK